jgi:hypothetical protein
LAPILRLIERIAGTPQADELRAGMSMATLLISAMFETDGEGPFIAVAMEPMGDLFRIEYLAQAGGPVLMSTTCEEGEAMRILSGLFIRLWNESPERRG